MASCNFGISQLWNLAGLSEIIQCLRAEGQIPALTLASNVTLDKVTFLSLGSLIYKIGIIIIIDSNCTYPESEAEDYMG